MLATLCSSLDATKENLIFFFLSFLASSNLLLSLAQDMVLCLQSQWWQVSPHSVLSHMLSSGGGIPPSHSDVFLFSEYKACASFVTFVLGTVISGIVFIVLFLGGLLLVHRNKNDFCFLDLSCKLAELSYYI